MSDTRFSAYFEKSIENFEKRTETTITALKKRTESTNKEVRDKAFYLLKKICTKEFLLINLGLLDIYRLLGSISCQLQRVEQFPWDIPKIQRKLLETLNEMEKLNLMNNYETGEMMDINMQTWPNLGEKIDFVLNGEYVSVQTSLALGRRKGRSGTDISPSSSLLTTVENRLTSLCKHLGNQLLKRITENSTPSLITTLGKCLDLEDILKNVEVNKVTDEMKQSLRHIAEKAKYNEEHIKKVLEQYNIFIERFQSLTEPGSEYDEIVKRFEHIIFQTHICSSQYEKSCNRKGKVLQPREPKVFKLLHLFLK